MPYDATSDPYDLSTVDVTALPTIPTDSEFWNNFNTALETLFRGAEKTLGLYTAYEYAKQRARTGQVLTSPEQAAGQTYLMGEAFGQAGILWIVILVGLVIVLMFAIKT